MASTLIAEKGCVSLSKRARAVYVSISGSIADSGVTPLEAVDLALDHPKRLIIVDLRRAPVLEPTAVEWIEQLSALCDSRGLKLRVVSPKGSKPARILSLLQFDRFIVIAGTVFEALRFGRPMR